MTEIAEVLKNIGYNNLRDAGLWYRTSPLYRESDNNSVLAINKNTGYWYDYKLCQGGNLSELIRLTLGFNTLEESEAYLKDNLQFVPAPQENTKTEIKTIKKFDPESLKKLVQDHEYWENRGVKPEITSFFQGGVATDGAMKNRYVFPIFSQNGSLIGFSGRDLTEKSTTKWKHYGATKNWVYPAFFNQKEIEKTKTVIIIESIGDMLALWQAGYKNMLVVFGLNLHASIIKFLLSLRVEKIYICFNNDSAKNNAGNEAAEKTKYKLMQFFDSDNILIKLPNAKDFGEMTLDQIKDFFKNE